MYWMFWAFVVVIMIAILLLANGDIRASNTATNKVQILWRLLRKDKYFCRLLCIKSVNVFLSALHYTPYAVIIGSSSILICNHRVCIRMKAFCSKLIGQWDRGEWYTHGVLGSQLIGNQSFNLDDTKVPHNKFYPDTNSRKFKSFGYWINFNYEQSLSIRYHNEKLSDAKP